MLFAEIVMVSLASGVILLIFLRTRKTPTLFTITGSLLLLNMSVSLFVYNTKPFMLEEVTNRFGRSIANANMVLNPILILLFVIGLILALLVLFGYRRTFDADRPKRTYFNTAIGILLVFALEQWFILGSLDRLGHNWEEHERIYDQLGGHG